MTQEQIQQQIEDIRKFRATKRTPEESLQFLIDAGIIKPPKKKTKARTKKK
jgi:hypothetical protein